jgi:hypothetical protein
MDSDIRHDVAVTIVGLLVVAGIIYFAIPSSPEIITGYVIPGQNPGCCSDCSCPSKEACSVCDKCIWTGECSTFWGGLNPEGLELVHSGRVEDGTSFTLNAVVHSQKDGQLLLNLRMPNGFSAEGGNSVPISLKAGKTVVVPITVNVKENVAETDHLIRADLVDYNWRLLSWAEASVTVWWNH